MVRMTKAMLEELVEQLTLELETLRLEKHIAEEEAKAASAQTDNGGDAEIDRSVVDFVKRRIRPNGPPVLNVRLASGPVDEATLARALGRTLVWVASAPRQDGRGRWWTNCIAAADDAAFRRSLREMTPDGLDL